MTLPEDRLNRPLVAAAWMLSFGVCMAAVAVLVRKLSQDLPVVQVTFFRAVAALPFLLPIVMRHGLGFLKTDKPVLHFLRAAMGGITMTLLFSSYALIPIGDATALSFLAPLFGSVIAVPLLGEIFGWRRFLSLIIALGGGLLIIRPGFQEIQAGHAFALTAAVGLALVSILLRKLGSSEPAERTVFYFTTLLVIGTLPGALMHWVTPNAVILLLSVALGLASTMAQISLTNAYRNADAVLVMPWDLFRLVFAALVGWLIFADGLDWQVFAGGFIIIAASVYTTIRELQHGQRAASGTAKTPN